MALDSNLALHHINFLNSITDPKSKLVPTDFSHSGAFVEFHHFHQIWLKKRREKLPALLIHWQYPPSSFKGGLV
jgi:hypothetical protein